MFRDNGKISEKQLERMLMLPVFAGIIFVLPFAGAAMFGDSCIWGLFFFFLFAVIYITGLSALSGQMKDAYYNEPPTGLQRGLCLTQIIRQTIHLSFYIVLSIAVLGDAQVPFMEGSSTDRIGNLLVVLPLILVALYGANHNVEKMGRLYEMLFWVVFIPYVIMILFGLKEVDYGVFIPSLKMPLWEIMLCSYALLTFVVPGEQFLLLRSCLVKTGEEGQNRGMGKRVSLLVIIAVALAILLTLFIFGIYGIRSAAMEEMVTVDIMRYIRLPLRVLERFDALMVWFFMLGCFVLMCSSLFAGGHYALKLRWGKRIFWLIGMVAVSLLIVLWLPDYKETLWLYLCYGAVFDVPLSVLFAFLSGKNDYVEENEN